MSNFELYKILKIEFFNKIALNFQTTEKNFSMTFCTAHKELRMKI